MEDLEPAMALMQRLRGWGVRFAIDDFGTGYSSLAYLQALSADALKLDQRFVAHIEQPATRVIVSHLIALAHELSMRVVAEGVENEAQMQRMRELGADLGQGYRFGRPMDAQAAWDWWRAAGKSTEA